MRRDDMTLNFFFPPETAANVKRNIPYVRESSGAQISVKSSHLVIKGGVAAVHKAQCRLAAYTSPTKERSIPYAILLKMQDTTRLRFQVAHPNVGHRGSVNKAAESAGCVDAQSQQSDSVGQFAPGLYALQFPEIQSQAHGAPNDVLASMPKEFRFRDPTKSGGSKIRGSPMVERVSPQEDDSHLWTFFLRKFSDWFYRSSLVPRPAKSGNSSMRAFSTFKTALFKVHVSLTDVEIEFWEFKAAVATGKIEVRIYNYSPCSVVEPILKRYKLNAGCGEPTPFYKSTILGWCRNINNSWSQWASQVMVPDAELSNNPATTLPNLEYDISSSLKRRVFIFSPSMTNGHCLQVILEVEEDEKPPIAPESHNALTQYLDDLFSRLWRQGPPRDSAVERRHLLGIKPEKWEWIFSTGPVSPSVAPDEEGIVSERSPVRRGEVYASSDGNRALKVEYDEDGERFLMFGSYDGAKLVRPITIATGDLTDAGKKLGAIVHEVMSVVEHRGSDQDSSSASF